MSITVDYFFNDAGTLSETCQLVNQSIGSSLLPSEGEATDLYCRFLGMELSLAETEFENDGDLNFEDFRFHLSFRTSVGAGASSRYAAYALRCAKGIGGMLVFDGQLLLARYEQRHDSQVGDDRLFDTLSDQFVVLPDHLNVLEKYLTDGLLSVD
jgi:hypothetical protein